MKSLTWWVQGLAKTLQTVSRPKGVRRWMANALDPAEPQGGSVDEFDSKLFVDAEKMLQSMLLEVDELSTALPADARPIAVAARELVERSLDECRKPKANAAKLADDMAKVNVLALAMRERLLLSPDERSHAFAN